MSVTHRPSRSRTAVSAIAAGALLAPALALVPAGPAAAAGDKGLFGSQDPTYDGVYRQGLAITGLAAADRDIPRSAVKWLLRQQCDNGSFLSHRVAPAAECPKADPANFTGPDSNSTAFGAMALWVAGERGAAKRAAKYLRTMRNDDGGFAYYRGGTSDANSTSLAMAALSAVPVKRAKAARKHGTRYLRSVQLRCRAPQADRGLLSYVASPMTPNLLASAQGGLALVTAFPPDSSRKGRTSRLRCDDGRQVRAVGVRETVLDSLKRQLNRNDGLLPNQFGGGSDYSATAQAVIALAAARRADKVVTTSVKALKRNVDEYTGTAESNAGALATLLNLTAVTDTNPKRFGGVNLGRELLDTLRRG